MQGDAERAREKTRRITPSASPTYEDEYTSAGEREMKATPAEPAAARANVVFAQPGGPCSKIPLGGASPNLLKSSLLLIGHSTALRSAVYG